MVRACRLSVVVRRFQQSEQRGRVNAHPASVVKQISEMSTAVMCGPVGIALTVIFNRVHRRDWTEPRKLTAEQAYRKIKSRGDSKPYAEVINCA